MGQLSLYSAVRKKIGSRGGVRNTIESVGYRVSKADKHVKAYKHRILIVLTKKAADEAIFRFGDKVDVLFDVESKRFAIKKCKTGHPGFSFEKYGKDGLCIKIPALPDIGLPYITKLSEPQEHVIRAGEIVVKLDFGNVEEYTTKLIEELTIREGIEKEEAEKNNE